MSKKKSKYAKKLSRKLGRGTVDPRWMWWTDRVGKPRPLDKSAPPGPRSNASSYGPSLRAALLDGLQQ